MQRQYANIRKNKIRKGETICTNLRKTEDQELLLESLKEVYERNDLDAYFKECDEKHEFPQKAIDVMVDAGFCNSASPSSTAAPRLIY